MMENRAAVDQAIVDRINAKADELPGTPAKRIWVVRPAALAAQPVLASPAEVDAYLEALRERLIQIVDAGDQVQLK